MKNVGSAYRKRAMELVSLCRTFVQVQEQTPISNAELRAALQAVDDALGSAAQAKKKTAKEVDEKLKRLSRRCTVMKCASIPSAECRPPGRSEKMAAAEAGDKTTSTMFDVLKETLRRKKTEDVKPEPTKVVEFLLFDSLPDPNPTIVRQVLSRESKLQEILWNFSRVKGANRLTLKSNPHFYKYTDLPASRAAYVGEFKRDPVETFQHDKICVLRDKPGCIFLKTDQNERAFGNVWVPKNAIILKDICGKLEGESIVQASISTHDAPTSWYLEEPLLSPTPQSALSPNQGNPPPAIKPSPTHSASDGPPQDWRDLIRRTLTCQHTDIRIRGVSPNNSRPDFLAPSSSRQSVIPNGNDDDQSSKSQIPTHSAAQKTHRAPRSTAISPQPLPSLSSPISPVAPSPTGPSVPLPHQPPIWASPRGDRAIPTLVLPIAPTPPSMLQRSESQESTLTEETPTLLQTPSVGGDIASPTVIVASPSLSPVTDAHRLHPGGGRAISWRNPFSQAHVRGPEQKKPASLSPNPAVTPARLQAGEEDGFLNFLKLRELWLKRCNQG
ncbi:hypothetical protein BC826DRAFT_738994 [Russula brevipes]|nr:hypothetical protein BC826DRAFT_738994 [Russula brevipes]